MTNNELINDAVKRINKNIAPMKISYNRISGGNKLLSINGKTIASLCSLGGIFSFLDGFETAIEETSPKYQVNVTSIYEGCIKFDSYDEFFTTLKDAQDYFKHNLDDFLETEKDVEFDAEDTDRSDYKEFWWGESHWRITLKKIERHMF